MTPQTKRNTAIVAGIPALAVFVGGMNFALEKFRGHDQAVTRAEWSADTAVHHAEHRQQRVMFERIEATVDKTDARVSAIYCATVPPAQRAGCR